MGRKAFTDKDGDEWTRVDDESITWERWGRLVQVRPGGEVFTRVRANDPWKLYSPLFSGSNLVACAREAWAALMAEPARPETVEVDGTTWRRHLGGIDIVGNIGIDSESYIGFQNGVLGRFWPPDCLVRFTSFDEPSGSACITNIRKAWEALIGECPEQAPQDPPVEVGMPTVGRLKTRGPAANVPVHHWSFRCAPSQFDVERIYREMGALGVSRKQVSISVRARGKRSIRVAVHSGG